MTRTWKSLSCFCFVSFLTAFTAPADASSVYLQTFDDGTPLSTDSLVNNAGIGSFWKDAGATDGLVIQNTSSTTFGNSIMHDAGGTGYFLFEGTQGNPPDGQTDFYSSADFSVTPNTDYLLSFDVVNASTCNQESYDFTHCSAILQPAINGQNLGSPISADDVLANFPEPWVTYSFTWNSGDAVLAHLDLFDTYPSGIGNDFGVDNIQVAPESASAPEPATLSLLGLSLAALVGVRRRRAIRK